MYQLLLLTVLVLGGHAQGKPDPKVLNRDTAVTVVAQPAPVGTSRADSLYIIMLEKTNQQLSLWWNPYGVFIAALGVLFTVATIVVGFILFRQSREYSDMIQTSIKKYEAILDTIVKGRLAEMETRLEGAIGDAKTQLATATEEQKGVLEKRIADMERQRDELKSAEGSPFRYQDRWVTASSYPIGLGWVHDTSTGIFNHGKHTCVACGKVFDVQRSGSIVLTYQMPCPHCGIINTVTI